MNGNYRVGIIGMGYAGYRMDDSHFNAYNNCKRTKLVAVSDVNPAIDCDREYYQDYTDMIKTCHLDIVSVCTPDETHCKVVCDIAPYVEAIFLEKPIALALEDADKMIEVCEKYGVLLQVNHKRRFSTPVMRFSRGIIRNGTHAIDLCRQLFGEAWWVSESYGVFGERHTLVAFDYVDTDESIFELDCTHNSDKDMTLKGLINLVNCLDGEHILLSSGEEARETLRVLLDFKRQYDKRISTQPY